MPLPVLPGHIIVRHGSQLLRNGGAICVDMHHAMTDDVLYISILYFTIEQVVCADAISLSPPLLQPEWLVSNAILLSFLPLVDSFDAASSRM